MLNDLVSATIDGLRRDCPEMADAVKKWSVLLINRVNKAAAILEVEPEDVFAEMCVGLVKVREMHSRPIYRFAGNLYRIVDFDGNAVQVHTLRYNTRLVRCIWTDYENLAEVQKASMSSSVYREINQQYSDMLSALFCAKRGYVKKVAGERAVVSRSGAACVETKKRKVFDVQKTVHLVSIERAPLDGVVRDSPLNPTIRETVAHLTDDSGNPEGMCSSREFLLGMGGTLSDEAHGVLGFLLEDPSLTDQVLARCMRISRRRVRTARVEILRDFSALDGSPVPTLAGKKPVYPRASQVC